MRREISSSADPLKRWYSSGIGLIIPENTDMKCSLKALAISVGLETFFDPMRYSRLCLGN